MSDKIAVITSDPKLSGKLIDWLAKQEAEPDSTLIIVGYDERDRAIDCLASEITVHIDGDKFFIDDDDCLEGIPDEISDRALEMAEQKAKNKE